MKKTLLIILALILVLAFTVGCGNNNDSDSAASDANGTAVTADGDEETFRGSDSAILENFAADFDGGAVLDLDEGETQRTGGPGVSIDNFEFRSND